MSSSSFQRLKHIPLKTKHLINGYIKNCQNELFGERTTVNPYYNIPELINNYCILFYELFTWYKKHYGSDLQFLSDRKVTRQNFSYHQWDTCMFGNVISSEYCNSFAITFEIISFGSECPHSDFYIGYTNGESLDESILNWNDQLGEGDNQKTSSSWGIGKALFHSGTKDCYAHVKDMTFEIGDLLKLVIDFKDMKAKIYHNGKEEDCRIIQTTRLWIGLSFWEQGETVEMIKYEYQ